MSIASEITRISGNIADAYTALDAKGATLPAAGSQNSANLADTIDTITTGGGGSGSGNRFRAPIYDFMDAEIDKVTYQTTYADLENDGYVLAVNDSDKNKTMTDNNWYSKYVNAFIFTDDVPNLISLDAVFTSSSFNQYGNIKAVKLPQGAVLNTTVVSGYSTIDFTNCDEKWVIIVNRYVSYRYCFESGLKWAKDSSVDTFSYYGCQYIKYIGGKNLQEAYANSTATEQMFNSNTNYYNLEDFYFPNLKDSLSVTDNALDWNTINGLLKSPSDRLSASKIASVYANITRKVTRAKNGHRLITETGRSTGTAGISSSPLVFDCSSDTTARTVFIGCPRHFGTYTGSYYVYDFRHTPREFFFIPSSYWDLSFVPLENDNSLSSYATFYDRMTTESYKFLADNAPSVSGKTIYMLTNTKNRLNSEDATIISTLESKGYTITTK